MYDDERVERVAEALYLTRAARRVEPGRWETAPPRVMTDCREDARAALDAIDLFDVLGELDADWWVQPE